MNDWPRCGAALKRGVCESAVIAGPDGEPGDACAFHSRQASLEPDAAVRVDGASGSTDADAAIDEAPATVERIASLRAALREGSSTAEVAELIQAMILDGLRASRDVFHTCSKCGKRDPVSLPDLNTRISAARALVEELEGKMQAQDPAVAIARAREKERHDMDSLTDDELALLIEHYRAELGEPEPDKRELVLASARRVIFEHEQLEVVA